MEQGPAASVGEHVATDLDRDPRRFTVAAQHITIWAGSASAAVEAVVTLLAWIALGFFTSFPHWWEVGATVSLSFVTLLMLILIQHTQNHDDRAVQLKLDELIRAQHNSPNEMMRLEDASHEDLERIRRAFEDEATG
jgi:low affinity Fe/Cu permease